MPSPGVSGAISRNSPAIHGDDVIVGDIEAGFGPHNGANIIAADRRTGALHWITKVDSHVAAVITGSPVVFGNVAYVGVSSQEEALALLDNPAPIPPFAIYHCCTFRGSVVALDANTGKLLWKTYVMPENGGNPGGYSGGAIWQPPAIDPIRRQLYIGTVNNYSAPKSVLDCETQAIADNNPDADCTAPDDFFETALALDQVGPGGNTGGIQWGTATDGWRVYVAITNSNQMPYTLVPSGQQITWGAWSALNAFTGKPIWQTADPTVGAIDMGSVSVANGVMYAGSQSGSMYALDAASGKILWSFASGGTVLDGPSIVDGVVYWGSGYNNPGTPNNKLYAFSIEQHKD